MGKIFKSNLIRCLFLTFLAQLGYLSPSAQAKEFYDGRGNYIGEDADGILLDNRGRQRGYITDDGQYLDNKARPKGYIDEGRILDVNGGQPYKFDDSN